MEPEVKSVQANILGVMFPWQKELVDIYIKKGSLPPYPIHDINSKRDQSTLKSFLDNFVEELSEAYSELDSMYECMYNNDVTKAKEHLRAYNEEIADAWHFLLEFLLYTEYTDTKLDELLQPYCQQLELPYHEGRPWSTIQGFGSFMNNNFQRGILRGTPFRVVTEKEAQEDITLLGGRRIDNSILLEHSQLLWDVTHRAQRLKNSLKNRAWTNTERSVNIPQFEELLLRFLYSWGIYMDYSGFTQGSIVISYHRKSLKNIERQKNGY